MVIFGVHQGSWQDGPSSAQALGRDGLMQEMVFNNPESGRNHRELENHPWTSEKRELTS